jgi:hypothetical protein
MAKIIPQEDMVVVEPYNKAAKREGDSPFASVVVSNNFGTIKYSRLGPEVGLQVYFGGQYERIIMEGVEVLAMKRENVIAWVQTQE